MKKNRNDVEGFEIPGDSDETPKTHTAPATPARAVQAHPVPSQIVHAEPAQEQAEEVFPKCLRKSIAILQQSERDAENSGNLTRQEQRSRRERLSRIRAHVFALQQGLPTLNTRGAERDPNLVRKLESRVFRKQ